jgi:hypothetical protein
MPPNPSIYHAADGCLQELGRAAAICLIGVPEEEARAEESGFAHWMEEQFFALAAPHVIRCSLLARGGDISGVAALDGAFSLPPGPVSAASLRLGAAALGSHDGARHCAGLDKFRAAVRRGDCPGHLATVVAIRGAAFHLGTFPVLHSLCFAEWRRHAPRSSSAAGPEALRQFAEAAAGFLPRIPPLLHQHGHPNHMRLAAV